MTLDDLMQELDNFYREPRDTPTHERVIWWLEQQVELKDGVRNNKKLLDEVVEIMSKVIDKKTKTLGLSEFKELDDLRFTVEHLPDRIFKKLTGRKGGGKDYGKLLQQPKKALSTDEDYNSDEKFEFECWSCGHEWKADWRYKECPKCGSEDITNIWN